MGVYISATSCTLQQMHQYSWSESVITLEASIQPQSSEVNQQPTDLIRGDICNAPVTCWTDWEDLLFSDNMDIPETNLVYSFFALWCSCKKCVNRWNQWMNETCGFWIFSEVGNIVVYCHFSVGRSYNVGADSYVWTLQCVPSKIHCSSLIEEWW